MSLTKILRQWGKLLSYITANEYKRSLKLSGKFTVHYTSEINGLRFIDIGQNFYLGKRNRIDAIESYNGKTFTPRIKIGSNVTINDDVHIACIFDIEIGDNVLIASKVFISDHNHGSYSLKMSDLPTLPPGDRELVSKPITIESNVWIGEMVCILSGVTIGYGSIIGSGAVISKDVPPNSIVVGHFNKIIKRFDHKENLWK